MADKIQEITGAGDAYRNIAIEINKITIAQEKQLAQAKALNIAGELLSQIKARQISNEQKLSSLQTNIAAKTEKLVQMQRVLNSLGTRHAAWATSIRADMADMVAKTELARKEHEKLLAIMERERGNLLVMQKSGLQGLVDKTKEWNTMMKASPFLLISAATFKTITYSFKQIWDIFDTLDSAAADFRKSMGIVRTQSADIESTARGIAIQFMGIGVSAKDVYESFKAISETAGSTRAYTDDMVKDMSVISAQFGITAKTSAGFLKTMAAVSKSTMSTQKDMLLVAQRMSAAAGVPLDAVMQDVASATERGYQFLSREPLILLKAAVQAKLLGTSLQSSTTSAAHLLQFTESVKNEMEASVLLGRGLNLQKARELAYNRDIEGLNKEIVKLAKEANFEQLDPFQQDAVAKVMGKQAGEVANMLESDREHNRILQAMSATERQRYNALMNINKSQVKDYAEKARNEIQTLSNQKAIAAITAAWSSIFAKLGEVFLPYIASTLEWIAKTLNKMSNNTAKSLAGFIAITGVIGTIVGAGYLGKMAGLLGGPGGIVSRILGGMSTAFSGLSKGISNAVKEIVKAIKSVISIIGPLGTQIGKFISGIAKGIGTGISAIFKGIASGIKFMGDPKVFLGILAIGLLGVSLIPFAYAMKLMTGLDWKSLAVAAVGLVTFTAAAFGLGALMMSGAGAVIFGAGVIAIAALGLALLPLAFSAEKAGKAMVNLGNGFKSVVDSFVVLQALSFAGTILQLYNLTDAILSVSDAINNMPDIQIDKLQSMMLPSLAVTSPVGGEKGNKQDETLVAIKDEITALRSDMKTGVLTATVYLDSQRLDSMSGRRLAYTGQLA